MNKIRRQRITEAVGLLEKVMEIIDEVQTEEQDAFDSLPEGIQVSERGQAMEDASDRLGYVLDELGSQMEELEDIRET